MHNIQISIQANDHLQVDFNLPYLIGSLIKGFSIVTKKVYF